MKTQTVKGFGVVAVLIIAMLMLGSRVFAGGGTNLLINEVGWSGTGASSSDEWYELKNVSSSPIDTEGWVLQMVKEDGTVVTATVPFATIQPQAIALFERTDDTTISNRPAAGINGSGGTGSSLVGIFSNSGIGSLSLIDPNGDTMHQIISTDGDWPAGSSSPRASMQLIDGTFVTSNASDGGADADGNPVLGTPGNENSISSNPSTCGELPTSWEYEVELVLFEDWSTQMQVVLTADLWGVAPDGNLIATEGEGRVVWVTASDMGPARWVASTLDIDQETSAACLDAMANLIDATDSYMNGVNDGACAYLNCENGTNYVNWLDGLLAFQRTGLHSTFLPYVAQGD